MTLPEGWKPTTLGSVLERVTLPVNVEPSREYREIGIRSHGKGIFHKPLITGKSLGEKRVFWVVPGALVLNIVFAWEQAVAVTSIREEGMIASHRFPMYRPKDGKCDIRFLLHFFKTSRGKETLEIASPGGAGRNKTLGQKEFEKLKIALPPVPEQVRIASLLDTYDKAIEIEERLTKVSRAQRATYLEDLLSGHKRLPGFESPWKKFRLADVAEVIVSNVDKKTSSTEISVALCNYTDVYYNDFLHVDHEYMQATATDREIERFRVIAGDVLITKDSESADDIAVAAHVLSAPSNLVCGYHLAILRPRDGLVSSDFLGSYFSLSATRRYFQSSANGVTRFGLPASAIEDAPIQVPGAEEQKMLSHLTRLASEGISGHVQQLALLRRERVAATTQLMSGRRRFRPGREQLGTVST